MNPIETSHEYIFYKFAAIIYTRTMIGKKITVVFFSFYLLHFRINDPIILFSFIYTFSKIK